nr:MAG TPA: hypothetical protein [Caudoviricetes sp.]
MLSTIDKMSYQQPHIQRPQVSGVCGRSGNWIYGSTTGRVGCHNAMKYSLNIRRKTGVVIKSLTKKHKTTHDKCEVWVVFLLLHWQTFFFYFFSILGCS